MIERIGNLREALSLWIEAAYSPILTYLGSRPFRRLARPVRLAIFGSALAFFTIVVVGLFQIATTVVPFASVFIMVLVFMALAFLFVGGLTRAAGTGAKGYSRSWLKTLQEAEAGDLEAMCAMADHYRKGGHGIPAEPSQAVWWLMCAANRGSPRAAYELAGCFQRGEGVPKDLAKAREWHQAAAEAGYSGPGPRTPRD